MAGQARDGELTLRGIARAARILNTSPYLLAAALVRSTEDELGTDAEGPAQQQEVLE
jgi:hypothetical protein